MNAALADLTPAQLRTLTRERAVVLDQAPGHLLFLCWEDEQLDAQAPVGARARTTGRGAGPRRREARSRRAAQLDGDGSDEDDEGPRRPFSLREAASVLGIDRSTTLPALVRAGILRAIPWGASTRIPAADVARVSREGFPDVRASGACRAPSKRKGPAPRTTGAAIRALHVA
jgi:hypothetical protein